MAITANQRKYNLEFLKKKNETLFADKAEGVDYVVCKECGLKASQLSKHVKSYHDLTPEQYYEKHNCDRTALMSQSYFSIIQTRSTERNPGAGHGGTMSAHSPKFRNYIGLSEEEVSQRIAEVKARATEKRIEIPANTTLQYWLDRTDGNVEKAKELQSNRQRTFTLEKCIAKYGEDAGRARWEARQQKWSTSFAANKSKGGISRVAEDFVSWLPHGPDIHTSLNNGELSLKTPMPSDGSTKIRYRSYRPDYVNATTKKIIEFYGDYYHANPIKYTDPSITLLNMTVQQRWDRDAMRVRALREYEYQVLVVWEREYRYQKEETISKCLQFLAESEKLS